MPELIGKAGHKRGLSFILILLVLIDLAIFFDIPVLRQVLGLVLIVVMPGLLILFLLKLDKLGIAEKIVLTATPKPPIALFTDAGKPSSMRDLNFAFFVIGLIV